MGQFDHERLEVYRYALAFANLVTRLVPRRGCHVLRDQLDRSSLSVVLCIAEGAGRSAPADKRRFYAMARGSATESAAALDVLHARRLIGQPDHERARAQLLSIVRMLTRLCHPPSPEPRP